MARIFVVQCLLILVFAMQSVASNQCQDNDEPCGDICYSPHRNEGCCNSDVVFDTRQQICCGGNLLKINDGSLGCCAGRVFDKTKEICCDGNNYSRYHFKRDKVQNINKLAIYEECCGGVPHDDETHECCERHNGSQLISDQKLKRERGNYDCCNYRNGSVQVIDTDTEKCPDYERCGTEMYFLDQNICCQDRLLNYTVGLNRGNAICCNGSIYNRFEKSCCFEERPVVRFRDNEICCASSLTGKIDRSTHLCCANGPKPNSSASQKCCHDTVIDSSHEGCCHNSALNVYESFNLTTSICCGGNVVSKFTKCCGNQWILKDNEVCCPRGRPINVSDSQQMCCEGNDRRQVFDPRTQTCAEGIVASRLSCGGPGKICCQGVEHDARGGEVQCCEPGIHSYFRRNQTCCDGRVYNGSNLPCCGVGICRHTDTCPATFTTSCGENCLTNGQYSCCGGQFYPFRMGPHRLCCDRLTYSASTQRCVNGTVKELKMCPGQRCGGKLKEDVGCRGTNSSILVFEGIAKKLKDRSTVTFQSIVRLAKCGISLPKKTVYPKQIDYETPKKCKCNLKNGKMYMIVVKDYLYNQLQMQTPYRLSAQDLVLRYSLENFVGIKRKNQSPSNNRRKSN